MNKQAKAEAELSLAVKQESEAKKIEALLRNYAKTQNEAACVVMKQIEKQRQTAYIKMNKLTTGTASALPNLGENACDWAD